MSISGLDLLFPEASTIHVEFRYESDPKPVVSDPSSGGSR